MKYREEIKKDFSRLVYIMAKMGYVTMDFVAVDRMNIKADAGIKKENDRKVIEREVIREDGRQGVPKSNVKPLAMEVCLGGLSGTEEEHLGSGRRSLPLWLW